MDVKQLYGRNDMVMLEQHNKIYGSLGIAEQTILKTVEGNPAVLENPKPGVAENVITGFKMQGWTEQNGTPTPETPVPIVSAGTQNQDAGKWEYEITIANEQTDPDKNQTVTLTSDRPLAKWDKLEKRDGVWGWAFKSGTMTLDGTQPLAVYNNGFYFLKSDNWNTEAKDAYSDKLINKNRKNISGIPQFSESIGNKDYCYVLSVSEIYGSTTGELKQNVSQNPITFYYETAEETFVPLSESEQEAMSALEMYLPTTVITNDVDCSMIVTYKATQNGGESE